MAQRETVKRKQSRAPRDEQPDADHQPEGNGKGEELAADEQELASYLEERIKPGLNSGAIPMLARSIAREIAGGGGEDEDEGGGGDATDLEADLHTLQQFLGEDWTLFYAVHGDDAWLIAETQDASQRLEAANAEVLVQAVGLLNQSGGRSGTGRSSSEDEGDGDGD
jgi:hypothetical protein